MSQKPRPGQQGHQPHALTEDSGDEEAQDETPEGPLPSPNRPVAQEPQSILHTRRVSIQEPPPVSHARRVSIQEPPPVSHARRVSIQEHPAIVHTRRVSVQEPPPVSYARRVSVQEPSPVLQGRRVSIQEPPPVLHARRVSVQEPSPVLQARRVSIQEPPPVLHARRVSVQEPSPVLHGRRVSIQEPPPVSYARRLSVQEPSSILRGRRASVQEPSPADSSLRDGGARVPSMGITIQRSIRESPSVSSVQQASPQDSPPSPSPPPSPPAPCDPHLGTQLVTSFQIGSPGVPRPLAMPPNAPVAFIESVAYRTQAATQGILVVPQNQGLLKCPNRASVDVPPSITDSPEASMESMESILWSSQEDLKASLYNLRFSKDTSDKDSMLLPSSTEVISSMFLEGTKRRYSQLPIGTKMLHEAKKISRQLSLVMSVLGIMIIGLITLGQPWVHFQVPLEPPGGPADPPPRTMSINTIFFVRCLDVSCLHEQDHNAYLLDSAWAFFLISSFTSFCLCLCLIDITFFSGSSVPLLDFSNVILSNLTGTTMVLGILFYLLQAHEFLQEGMTYSLGHSFYLAWIAIFFFMTIGLLSYMNYVNFWSILASQGIWT